MNILIDVRLMSRGESSGIHAYTRLLVEHLIAKKSEHRYLLFYPGFRKIPLPFPSDKNGAKVSIIDWKIPNRILDASFRLFHAPAIDIATGADVVLSPHINILKTKKRGRIMTFHDLSFLHYPSFFSQKQRLWHALQDWKREAEHAAHIIADSDFTKSDLVAVGIDERKISVVYPGIDPSFRRLTDHDPRRAAFRKRRNISAPFLLSLGTLEPRKNIPAAIRAFSELKKSNQWKDLLLVVAGSPGWLYHDTLREAHASPVRNDILFLGPVEDSERILLYNEARAFVYPSFFEGFGFPPLEAQACGCPVVVSNRTSLPEIIGNSGIAVSPWDIGALTEGLARALEDGRERTEFIRTGYLNAARFQWGDAAQKIENIMEDVYRKKSI
jgi:glycosyltransferase involved in cell wall biosynthesis